ncbi:MAG TPA: HD domain-containing protein [Chloroflexota bacterium]
MTTSRPVQIIADLFASEGATDYLGEAVTQVAHMLQAATLAEGAGAGPPLVAAALLHDVGHFTGTVSGRDLMRGTDNKHSEQGANWLARWFGPEVTEPVRLHVDAKRYLCAIEPGYLQRLSPASVYTLGVQGGPMGEHEAAEFTAKPFAADACRVRRWDDEAKVSNAPTPAFEHFGPVLAGLVRSAGRGLENSRDGQ